MERATRIDPWIRHLVSHDHVDKDYLAVLRHVISRLADGYPTFAAGMSRPRRRELIRQVFACHAEKRDRGLVACPA